MALPILQQTTLGELVFYKRELWQLDSQTSVENALKFLQHHNILSAPVYDAKVKKYVGMIDTWDIMSTFALGVYFTDKITPLNSKRELLDQSIQMEHDHHCLTGQTSSKTHW